MNKTITGKRKKTMRGNAERINAGYTPEKRKDAALKRLETLKKKKSQ